METNTIIADGRTPSPPASKTRLAEAAEEFIRRWEGTGFGEYSHEDLAEKFRAALTANKAHISEKP